MAIGFPLIEIQGSTADRGFQYGKECKSLIDERIQILRNLFDASNIFDMSWDLALEKSKKFVPSVERCDPEQLEEIRGIAEGSGHKENMIFFLNVVYEFFSRKVPGVWSGCTAIAAMPQVTKDGVTLIGQNADWNEAFQGTLIILRMKRKSKPDVLQVCDAGTLGGNGVNSAGIALCANSLLSSGWSFEGVPHYFLKRGVLASEYFTDAISAITAANRCNSHNYLLAHVDGLAVDIEATPNEMNLIYPDEGFIVHANHFVAQNPLIKDLKVAQSPDSIIRQMRADQQMRSDLGEITIESMKRIFMDHVGTPGSICRHPDERKPLMSQMQTNASYIFDLTNRKFLVARGHPCENQYNVLEF
jgi:isopenicillin-N N-acyltransferase-like protein